jgi:thiol-disulfide isomerase/thioredoxin
MYTKSMNKKVLAIIAVIVLAIAGGTIYLLNSSSDKSAMDEMRAEKAASSDQSATPEVPTSNNPGRYIDYTADVIANTTGTKVLFFHAPWCPQCRALEADIKKQGVPAGVSIIKVDYDSNQTLRQKYGVTLQTTLVRVDDEGNLVKKFVAYDSPTLAAVKESLL